MLINRSTTAYIIHQHPYQNTSLIIHLFSKELGRFQVLAKGIKSNKRLNNILNPFQLIEINFKNKGSLPLLINFEVLSQFKLHHVLHKSIGLYFNELIYKSLTEKEPYCKIYNSYVESLSKIEKFNKVNSMTLRNFELILLEETGFGLNLDNDWLDSDGLSIDQNFNLIKEARKGQEICYVSDLRDLKSGYKCAPKSLKRASKFIFQAINLAVNFKKIHSRDLIKQLWPLNSEKD